MKKSGGSIVAWCLLMIALCSSLIQFQNARRQAGAFRNQSTETRMHLQYQTEIILGILSDCASRTTSAFKDSRTIPLPPDRHSTDTRQFPFVPVQYDIDDWIPLAVVICPLFDDGTRPAPTLFRGEQIAMPSGFSAWQYRNRQRSERGRPSAELQIRAVERNSIAWNALLAFHARLQGPDGTLTSPWILSDPQKEPLTLTFVLARQP